MNYQSIIDKTTPDYLSKKIEKMASIYEEHGWTVSAKQCQAGAQLATLSVTKDVNKILGSMMTSGVLELTAQVYLEANDRPDVTVYGFRFLIYPDGLDKLEKLAPDIKLLDPIENISAPNYFRSCQTSSDKALEGYLNRLIYTDTIDTNYLSQTKIAEFRETAWREELEFYAQHYLRNVTDLLQPRLLKLKNKFSGKSDFEDDEESY